LWLWILFRPEPSGHSRSLIVFVAPTHMHVNKSRLFSCSSFYCRFTSAYSTPKHSESDRDSMTGTCPLPLHMFPFAPSFMDEGKEPRGPGSI
jgi:hypothetical protein